jgi:sulfite exporter TauE/SafE
MLGAFAGMAGAAIAISPSVHQSAGIVFGSFMILFALYQLGWLDRLFRRKGSNRNGGILSKVLSSVNGSQKPEARLLMGLFTPLLPCGLLYAMLAAAAITHSPLHGAISMAGFAVGAMPGLMFAGTLSGFLSARMRKFGTHFAIVIIILMGLLTIGRGIGIYNGSLFDGLHDETTCGEQIRQKE